MREAEENPAPSRVEHQRAEPIAGGERHRSWKDTAWTVYVALACVGINATWIIPLLGGSGRVGWLVGLLCLGLTISAIIAQVEKPGCVAVAVLFATLILLVAMIVMVWLSYPVRSATVGLLLLLAAMLGPVMVLLQLVRIARRYAEGDAAAQPPSGGCREPKA